VSFVDKEKAVTTRILRRPALTVAAIVIAIGAASCGSSGDDDSTGTGSAKASSPAVAQDTTLAAMVPSDVASDGKLTIGTDASYAPNEFIDTDGKTIIGVDAELAQALAGVLGLKAALENAPFGTLVEGVKNGKFELGMSSFTINPEREAQVDMVSYFTAGTSWATEKGNPKNLTPDNACGQKVAVQKDTVQVPDVEARSKACTAAGKSAITIEQFPLQSDATSAVVTGKDDGLLADSPVVAYAVKQTGGKLEVVGDTYDAAPYGIAVPKGQGDYSKAIQGAVQKLMDDGTYLAILKRWNVDAGALTTAEINPSAS
jgi:polar amino acid transport system substrate-binding protein